MRGAISEEVRAGREQGQVTQGLLRFGLVFLGGEGDGSPGDPWTLERPDSGAHWHHLVAAAGKTYCGGQGGTSLGAQRSPLVATWREG